MAYRAVLLESCAEERAAIVDYLCNYLHNSQAAASFLDEFDAQVKAVCALPEAFPYSHYDVLETLGYRFFTVKNYLCLFKVEGGKVLLAHLFHQSQNYARYV